MLWLTHFSRFNLLHSLYYSSAKLILELVQTKNKRGVFNKLGLETVVFCENSAGSNTNKLIAGLFYWKK